MLPTTVQKGDNHFVLFYCASNEKTIFFTHIADSLKNEKNLY